MKWIKFYTVLIGVFFVCMFMGFCVVGQSLELDWAFNPTGLSATSYAKDFVIDDSGQVYVTGNFNKTIDFNRMGLPVEKSALVPVGFNSYSDIFLAKYSQNGNLLWIRTAGDSINSEQSNSITLDDSLNIYITGGFTGVLDFDTTDNIDSLISDSSIHQDLFFAKFNSAGKLIWQKRIGNWFPDRGTSVQTNSKGELYLGGQFTLDVDFDTGDSSFVLNASGSSQDGFMVHYDQSGDFIQGGDIGGGFHDGVADLNIDNSDNIIITGGFRSTVDFDITDSISTLTSSRFSDFYLAKYNDSLKLSWATQFSGTYFNGPKAISHDKSNNIYLAGYFGDTLFFFNQDTSFLVSHGEFDSFVAKFNPNGILQWTKAFNCQKNSEINGIYVNEPDLVYVTGAFEDSLSFFPDTNQNKLFSNGFYDGFISVLDSGGTLVTNYTFGGEELDRAQQLSITNKGIMYLTGGMEKSVDFDFGTNEYVLTTAGITSGRDFFLAKYVICDSNQYSISVSSDCQVPDGPITIRYNGPYQRSISYSLDGASYISDSILYQIESPDSIFIIDDLGCKDTLFLSNSSNNPSFSTYNENKPDCGQSNGSATINVSGGNPPYSYSWSTGDTIPMVDSLSSGIYQLSVIDSLGCIENLNVIINDTTAPIITDSIVIPSCVGTLDGEIHLQITQGQASYSILWSTGDTTTTITNLGPGNYFVTVTDFSGCIAHKMITIPDALPLDIVVSTTETICTDSTGTASVNAIGGAGGFSFQWSSNSSNTSNIDSNLASGVYWVRSADTNGCADTTYFAINEQGGAQLSLSSINVGNCGSSNGSIHVNATGGVMPYQSVLWNTGDTSLNLQNVDPGSYELTLLDGNNCSSILLAEVPSVPPLYHSICLVTVDTATDKNLVVWEKPYFNGSYKQFNIYRENFQQNVYEFIDSIPFDSLSEYSDPVADPQIRSWRYKISVEDSCGVESALSFHHKTIHLVLSSFGGNNFLSWDRYEGATYYTYNIWRYSDQTNWIKIDSLPGNLQTYTDLGPTGSNLNYFVEAVTEKSCTSEKAKTYGTTRSNKKHSILSTAIFANFMANPSITSTGEIVQFSDLSSGFPDYWKWEFEGGNPPISFDQNPTVTYNQMGAYGVKLTASNSFTSDSMEQLGFILVNANGIEISDLNQEVLVYPIPSSGEFNIQLSEESSSNIPFTVTNVYGQAIMSSVIKEGNKQHEIDLSPFESGSYLLTMYFSSGPVHQKLIKK